MLRSAEIFRAVIFLIRSRIVKDYDRIFFIHVLGNPSLRYRRATCARSNIFRSKKRKSVKNIRVILRPLQFHKCVNHLEIPVLGDIMYR